MAAGVMAYVHPEVVEAMVYKDEVDACAEAVNECCPWTWAEWIGSLGADSVRRDGGMGRP